MLDSVQAACMVRKLFHTARDESMSQTARMTYMLGAFVQEGLITQPVMLDAVEQIEDFYERHICRLPSLEKPTEPEQSLGRQVIGDDDDTFYPYHINLVDPEGGTE